MEREEILELVNMVLDIRDKGRGINGFPYAQISIANCGDDVTIEMMDGGLQSGHGYDGRYTFGNNGVASERMINDCKKHLKELNERAKGFGDSCMDMSVPIAETI